MQSNSESISPVASTPADRRKWMRFQDDAVAVTVSDKNGRYYAAQVTDESFCGIGLTLPPQPDWVPGQAVVVNYNGGPMRAIVKHIEHLADGSYRVGLQWDSGKTG